ncbi:uncharacterized protein LOC110604703 [Manihot esculenta]|uniref:Uncharacterized protein n=1 Tax=Manihot esculenta TaxID=3983 RepID=A0ACB7G217_MANES|nr:uncharacterized protein LOC110604703 [Manihot esculenta]KAG8634125.1 hypothetical protein MANES_17G014501v8 [Manihot esculenta]
MSSMSGSGGSPVQSQSIGADSIILCRHGTRAALYTSWTIGNRGCRFFRCGVWEANDCSFFQWYDPPFTGHEKEVMTYLVQQKNNMKYKIKGLEENAMSLNEDFKILKEKCEEYESVIKDLQRILEVISKTNQNM